MRKCDIIAVRDPPPYRAPNSKQPEPPTLRKTRRGCSSLAAVLVSGGQVCRVTQTP